MSGPFLVDLWEFDLHGHPEQEKLAAAGLPWCGIQLKTSEGIGIHSDWFLEQWPKAKEVGGDRYGVDWFRGPYHYARMTEDPIKNAHVSLGRIELAGGWSYGDLWLMLDVEGANNPMHLGKDHVEHWIGTFNAEVVKATGRPCILYGNIYLAENGVTSTCGCGALEVARYTPTLPPAIYNRIGWTWSVQPYVKPPTLFSWQGVGDGDGQWAGPKESPIGKTDISEIVVANGGDAGLEWIRSNMLIA